MTPSAIHLDDPESVRIDDRAKSLSFFCRRNPVRIGSELVSQLAARSKASGGRNARVCLHERPDSPFHEMVILERRANYCRPHQHLSKGESYHLIEGRMAAICFDDAGGIVDRCVLEFPDSFLYRIGEKTYHTVLALTEYAVYHESKPGPFLGPMDSVYPDWAPDGTDPEAVRGYLDHLRASLGRNESNGNGE